MPLGSQSPGTEPRDLASLALYLRDTRGLLKLASSAGASSLGYILVCWKISYDKSFLWVIFELIGSFIYKAFLDTYKVFPMSCKRSIYDIAMS